MHAGQLKASLPCAISSNKEHALGERRRMALPGASVMSVARPTSVRHCAVTVKSMHGAFVLVVVGSQMCAVAHPGTHAPRGRRCCAGVTPGFQESCCCVQPINSHGLSTSGFPIDRSAPRCARKLVLEENTFSISADASDQPIDVGRIFQ